MNVDENQIATIVSRVVTRLQEKQSTDDVLEDGAAPSDVAPEERGTVISSSATVFFPDMDSAVEAAHQAFIQLNKLSIRTRTRIIERIRQECLSNVDILSRLAVEETGMGRVEDKINKNKLVINKTPGVEILSPKAWSGDDGLALMERAPYGVIGSITPCTNATETIICNAIGMIAGGNSVVFNAHPLAKDICGCCMSIINDAVIKEGGPSNLVTSVQDPSIATAGEMMKHPDIKLLVVTGGEAVVNAAMKSGKKVIAAGPGNPPAVVDETANIEQAARDIIAGASLDNNIVCVVEKEIIVVETVAEQLKEALKQYGGHEISESQAKRLMSKLFSGVDEKTRHGIVNKEYVGKDARVLLQLIDVEVRHDVRIIFTETDCEHPFLWTEMLMPVIPLVRVRDIDEAIKLAKDVEQGYHHTSVMHSRNIENLSKMANVCNTSIFVKNGPSFAGLGLGGEGHTSFTIASPTGEGLTTALHFTRERRCTLVDSFRIL